MYTYVKGQGWLPQAAGTVRMKCGTVVKLEMRDPVDGECFAFTDYKDGPEWDESLDPWYVFFAKIRYHRWTARQIEIIKDNYPLSTFVVAIPVDTLT